MSSDSKFRHLTRLADGDPPLIVSREDSEAVCKQVMSLTNGRGDTLVRVRSRWNGHIRWGRNQALSAGDITSRDITVTRAVDGHQLNGSTNQFDPGSLTALVRDLDQRILGSEDKQSVLFSGPQQYVQPKLWNQPMADSTAQIRSDLVRGGVDPVMTAALAAAGYLEVEAVSWAVWNTRGVNAYAAATSTLYIQSVRDPATSASGRVTMATTDWAKLDVTQLSAKAMADCRASAHPRAIEPGRYTTILRPAAVTALMAQFIQYLDLQEAEENQTIFTQAPGVSKIGEQVVDPRLTITTDPLDPECGYIPFDGTGFPYRPVTWIENGILKALSYNSAYARKKNLTAGEPLPNPQAFRMTGGDTSLDEMIATTERGVLVSRFGLIEIANTQAFWLFPETLTVTSTTQDGLWLIENGKLTTPVKNMRWIESSPTVLNKILQVGRSERVAGTQWFRTNMFDIDDTPPLALHQRVPAVVPPLKVRDFNFISLTDAV